MKRLVSIFCLLMLLSGSAIARNSEPCSDYSHVVSGWIKVVSNGMALLVIDYVNDYGQFRNAYAFPLEEGSLMVMSNVPEFATVERLDKKTISAISPITGSWDDHFAQFCITRIDELPFRGE